MNIFTILSGCLCALWIFAPLGLAIAWGQMIALYFKSDSGTAWTLISLLLLVPFGLSLGISLIAVPSPNLNVDIPGRFFEFSLHPAWWLLGLIGLVIQIVPPRQSASQRRVLVLVAMIYVVALVTSPMVIARHSTSVANESPFAFQLFDFFGLFAYIFFSVTLFLVTIYQPARKIVIGALVCDLILSLIGSYFMFLFFTVGD